MSLRRKRNRLVIQAMSVVCWQPPRSPHPALAGLAMTRGSWICTDATERSLFPLGRFLWSSRTLGSAGISGKTLWPRLHRNADVAPELWSGFCVHTGRVAQSMGPLRCRVRAHRPVYRPCSPKNRWPPAVGRLNVCEENGIGGVSEFIRIKKASID